MRKIFPTAQSLKWWLSANGYTKQRDGTYSKPNWTATVKCKGSNRYEVRAESNFVVTAPPFKAVETDLLEWCNERGCYRKVGELYSADVCNRIANKMNEV